MRRKFGSSLAGLTLAGLVFVTPALLAGCGGGGDGAPAGTQVDILATEGQVSADAVLVAFQDGAGAWQALAPTRSGGYTGRVTSADGRYGVAVVQGSGVPSVTVFYGTTAETTAFVANKPALGSAGPYTLSGTIAGLAGGNGYVSVTGGGTAVAGDGPYSTAIVAGPCDLLAARTDADEMINKVLIRRESNVGSNLTWDIDFAGAQAADPTLFTVTVTGAPAQTTSWTLRTKAGAVFARAKSGSTVQGGGLPAALRDPGDTYTMACSKNVNNASDATHFQDQATTSTPVDTTLELPPDFTANLTTAATTPYTRAKGEWTAWTGSPTAYVVAATTAASSWTVIATTGWLGSATSVSAPDLSGVTGWQAAWGPTAIMGGQVIAYHSEPDVQPVIRLFAGLPQPAGTRLRTTTRHWW